MYSEATLVFGSFCEGRVQQITASGVIAMKKCACLNFESKYEGAILWRHLWTRTRTPQRR